jgi:hypothetical protein
VIFRARVGLGLHTSGSGRAFLGLKNLLNKLGLIWTWARALGLIL